jgi:L-ascorbate metabolism protein UlaG (beta-lactamase superfamily)
MELQYYGANCLRLITKKAQIVVDDNLQKLSLKTITKSTDISLRTSKEVPVHESKFSADMPGEYEISGAIIHGVGARAHIDEEGKQTAVFYTVESDGIKIGFAGHIYPELSEDQLEEIGMLDVLVLPVGGNGYTMDGVGALKIVKQIEPKVVVPTHYADKSISYEVPQAELADSLKGLGMEVSDTVDKYKIKPTELSDSTQLVIIKKQ